jgi:hypothetical protein
MAKSSNSDEPEELEEDYYTFLNLPRNVSYHFIGYLFIC